MPDEPIAQVTASTTFQHEESWQQWIRSDKCLLLGLYILLICLLLHVSHDAGDKEIVSFMREGATGAFSGLMVALRGNKSAPVG